MCLIDLCALNNKHRIDTQISLDKTIRLCECEYVIDVIYSNDELSITLLNIIHQWFSLNCITLANTSDLT